MTASIYWHDYEAFGSDARRDRASQFAGVRTDHELNEIEAPLIIYCQPAPDMLPHPQACLITGITPQLARQRGVPEAEFIRQIHAAFSRPDTCVAGYNSIRFDDELTRQLLYRNFYDAYEREWKHGNSRWDIIDMLRLCHAVRPEGINWPLKEDGTASFRLEALSAANGIQHEAAHDALSDVRATIALARLVRTKQPRLFDYAFKLRHKQRVSELLNIAEHTPVLYVSSRYPAALGCLALAMPLAAHPVDGNGVLMYDLRVDPSPWLNLNTEQLQQQLFGAHDRQGDQDIQSGNRQRLPVNVLHTNRCPMLAPPSVLEESRAAQFSINMEQARRHWQLLRENPAFITRLTAAFAQRPAFTPVTDPDFMLYGGGFFSAPDKRVMNSVRQMDAAELAQMAQELSNRFTDSRLAEMLFRYRARNFPHSLDETEGRQWRLFCQQRLTRASDVPGAGPDLATFDALLTELEAGETDEHNRKLLSELRCWRDEVC